MKNDNNQPNDKPALSVGAVIGRRIFGRKTAMAISMIIHLKKGNSVFVYGCKDPHEMINRIKELGLDVQSEPVTLKKEVHFILEESTLNEVSKHTEENLVGYKFYCQ